VYSFSSSCSEGKPAIRGELTLQEGGGLVRHLSKVYVLFVFYFVMATAQAALAQGHPPTLPAKAYLLMDGASGQVLVDYDGQTRLAIASTTKMMTAILAIERGNLADIVTSGLKPYRTGGSTIYLDLGEQLTLENLLYALMLESANDAAVAIAEHLAGTEEVFAGWMTQKAKEIGAKETQFRNSHGLDQAGHYSTAYDLALIGRYAMSNEQFRAIVAVEEWEIPSTRTSPVRKLINRNRLLGYYPGANGVKNGYTEDADLTNVVSAKRGETELFAVVLGAKNLLWTSSMALLDYGFDNFNRHVVIKAGELVAPAPISGAAARVPAVAKEELSVLLPSGAGPVTSVRVWAEGLRAPLTAGTYVGELHALSSGNVVGKVDLVVATSVESVQMLAGMAGISDAISASVSVGGNLSWLWPVIFLGIIMMLNAVFRRRWRRMVGKQVSDKPFGRERLKAMRERRRS